MPGPTSPDIQPGPRMEQGVPLAKQIPFLRTENRIGALLRTLGRGKGKEEDVTKGREVGRAVRGFKSAKEQYNDPNVADKEVIRTRLVAEAGKLVDVQSEAGAVLTPSQQQYVDAVVVAAADSLTDKLPGDRWPGSSLERTEKYRQYKPHVLVRRTPDGLAVTVATGEVTLNTDGSVKINDSITLGEEQDSERSSQGKTEIAEYRVTQTTTSGGAAEGKLVYRDRTGREQSLVLHADDPNFMVTSQAAINRTVTEQSAQNSFYQYSGMVEGVRDIGNVRVTVISDRKRVDDARDIVAHYVANGGKVTDVPLFGSDGTTPITDPFTGKQIVEKQLVVLDVPGNIADRVYPNDPDGVRFAGILDRSQTLVESQKATVKAGETVRGEASKASLKTLLDRPGFVSIDDVETSLTDSAVGLATLSNQTVEQARETIDSLVRSVRTDISSLSPEQQRESAFDLVMTRLQGLVTPTTDNQQKAFWRTAELVAAGIDPNFKPTDRVLIDRARGLQIRTGGTGVEVVTDATSILNRTALDNNTRNLILGDIQRVVTGGNPNRSLQEMLRAAVDSGQVKEDQLTPEMKRVLGERELAPSTAAQAVERLRTSMPRSNETVTSFRSRLIADANSFGFGDFSEAVADAVLTQQRLDAASLREAGRRTIEQLAAGGELTTEAVRRLQESGQFSQSESTAFNSILDTVAGMPPLPTEDQNPEAYRQRIVNRLEQIGVAEASRGQVAEMVMRLNGMDGEAIDRRSATELLRINGKTEASADQLPPAQYITYLRLSHAPAETVVEAVGSYAKETPQDLGPLKELVRAYPSLKPMLDGLLSGMFMKNFKAREGESGQARRDRLVALVGELAGLSSDSSTMSEMLLALIPEVVSVEDLRSIARSIKSNEDAAGVIAMLQALYPEINQRQGRGNR